MKKRTGFLIVVSMLLVAGCARVTYTYPSRLDPALRAAPRSPVLVAVHDQRPYVQKKEVPETFAGLIRGGTGVVTQHQSVTGRPLVDDIANAVADRLRKNGATASTVHIEPGRTEAEAINDLMRRNPGLVLFVATRELKAEMNMASGRTTVSHDLVVTVFGKNGTKRGSAASAGKNAEDLDRYHLSREQERIATRINERLSAVLNDPAIVKALK